MVGALLTGVFAFGPLSATSDHPQGVNIGLIYNGSLAQVAAQAIAVFATLVWSGVITFIILMIVKVLVGLRVNSEEEREGLDIVLHGEQVF